jgi:zinc transporter ZupT
VDRSFVSKGLFGDADSHGHNHSAAHSHVGELVAQAQEVQRQREEEEQAAAAANAASAGAGAGASSSLVIRHAPSASKVDDPAASADDDKTPSAAPHSGIAVAPSADGLAGPVEPKEASSSSSSSPFLALAKKDAVMRAWVFFVALSLHSVLDGLSIGVDGEETEAADIAPRAIAVLGHKVFDGIALGVPVYLSGMPRWHANAAIVLAALSTPLGVALGIATSETVETGSASSYLANACILSLSAGSYLFISLMELFPATLHDGRYVQAKLGAFAVGWAAMAALASAGGHAHGSDEHAGHGH